MAWEGCQEMSMCSLRVSGRLPPCHWWSVSSLCLPRHHGHSVGGALLSTSCWSHWSFKHFCGLHLKPVLPIKITSLSTVRIRIENLYTFKQLNWINFYLEVLKFNNVREEPWGENLFTLRNLRLPSSSHADDNKCLRVLKIPQVTSLHHPIFLLRCAPESQSPYNANNHQRCPPLYCSITW